MMPGHEWAVKHTGVCAASSSDLTQHNTTGVHATFASLLAASTHHQKQVSLQHKVD